MDRNFRSFFICVLLPASQIFIIISNASFITRKGIPPGIIMLKIVLTCITEIIVIFLLKKYTQKNQLENELRDARYQEKISLIHKDSIKQQQLRLNDLHNRMLTSISSLLETLSSSGSTEQIVCDIKKVTELDISPYCQNQIVNAILTEKALQCINGSISLRPDINIDNDCLIAPHHLCSIFSNLLDNAIEAVLSLPPDRRIIKIRTQYRGDYLIIVVENSFSVDNSNRKSNSERGYGTQILRGLASQYHGNYLIAESDTEFKASIILQIG